MYASSSLVFVLSIARITVIRLVETPKYLLCEGKDEEVVKNFHELATKYNKPCSLTLEQLTACGVVNSTHSKSRFSVGEVVMHFRQLFSTFKIGLSTVLIWLSWTLIGLAYPLFYVFLNTYLTTRLTGTITADESWRNYALVNVASIFGPMLAGHMADWKVLGRKYTMVIGALITSK